LNRLGHIAVSFVGRQNAVAHLNSAVFSRPAAIQQHLVQAQRYIAREVNSLTPPRDGSWAGIGNQNKQARVRRTANGYEVQLFTHGDDNVHEGLFDNTREGLKKARRAIRGHLGV
jgi:hypothetical protein